jgi:pyruvate dehydrogenase (quinone)
MIAQAIKHDRPALVEVIIIRQEFSMPPAITLEQAKGFSLFNAKGGSHRSRRRTH